MDGITAQAMTPGLHELLAGSLIDRISMSDRQTLTLSLFTARRYKYSLTLSANPSRPGLELDAGPAPRGLNPPPSFAMYLRKHLRRAKIRSISSPPYERLFTFHLLTLDELGDEVELDLVFECMPRTANLILLNRDGVIMGALRHIDHRVNRVREVLPAHPYVPPPAQSGLPPDLLAGGLPPDFRDSLPPGLPLSRALARAVMGFSPLLADAVLHTAGLEGKLPPASLTGEEYARLASSLEETCKKIVEGDYSPAVYYGEKTAVSDLKPLAVHALPLPGFPEIRTFPTVYEAVTHYNRQTETAKIFEGRGAALQKRIADRIRQVQKKRNYHEADLAEGQKADRDQLWGELILAYLHTIPAGASEAHLANYYEEGKTVTVSLDPHLSAADNANRYFRRAKRKRRQYEAARKLLDRDLDELSWLESLAVASRLAESEEDLLAVDFEFSSGTEKRNRQEKEADSSRDLPGKPASKKRRQKQTFDHYKKSQARKAKEEPPLPPRRFTSSDGFLILSGRNNLQNDHLVRKAGRSDLWFHARNQPGSHVILVADQKEVPDRTLEEAAGIAAWYSGGGKAGSAVEIDYCLVRDVKKIPGGRPGRVTYQNFRTLYSRPLDPSALPESSL